MQAGRGDVEHGGDPRGLIRETDSRIAERADKAEADDGAREHFRYAGEYCAAGEADALCRHAADVEDAETPEEVAHAAQIFCGSVEHVACTRFNKERGHAAAEEDHDKADAEAVGDADDDAEPYALPDALRLFGTEILTAEDGNSRTEGIKRAHAELLQAHTGREARNIHAAEAVVRCLHDHAADGRDGGLKSHGDAHDDEVTDGFGIRFAVCAGKREERYAEADIDEAQNAADRLRCDGGDRRARNAPLEDNDAEQVKTDIQDGRDGEEQERRAAVTDGAQDAGEQIV